ncbi:MAG: alpha/beta hydrolase [Pseudomonadota bacterium]
MIRRSLAVFLTLIAVLAAGWLALRRSDISYDALEATYASPESRYLTLPTGLKIHYRDEGPRAAPVILLLHGYSSSLETWDRWTPTLEAEYRVVRMDLPGHGLSRAWPEADISIEAYVSAVDQFATGLGLGPMVLAGSSMGGNIAWRYAALRPERIDALVLVAASGWPTEREETWQSWLVDQPFARRLLKEIDLSTFIEQGLEAAFFGEELPTDAMVERYVAYSRAPGHRESLLALRANREQRMDATADAMAGISAPVLILQGAEDQFVAPIGGERFAAALPDAELRLYRGVGHLPHMEIPMRSLNDV